MAIPEGTKTHKDGGHLDQVFSNIDLNVEALLDKTLMTDHQTFKITIPFHKQEGDVDLRNMQTYTTAADTRAAARSDQTIKDLLECSRIIEQPVINLFRDRIRRRKVLQHWYEAAKQLKK
jgi:hypothetical protein